MYCRLINLTLKMGIRRGMHSIQMMPKKNIKASIELSRRKMKLMMVSMLISPQTKTMAKTKKREAAASYLTNLICLRSTTSLIHMTRSHRISMGILAAT